MAAPTKMTKEVIGILEDCFIANMNDTEACEIAGICHKTLDNYEAKHPEFLRKKKKLKQSVRMRARMNISKGINEGDKNDSKWFLERRDPDFKPKKETDLIINPHEDFIKMLAGQEKK
jgi:hypothetical protein